MKIILTLISSFIFMTQALSYEPFINFAFGSINSDDLDAEITGIGTAKIPGIFHLRQGESFEIELGIRDDSGLSVGLQSAYKKMVIEGVSLSGDPIESALAELNSWNAGDDFRIDGNFFTMPILAFVGKEIPLDNNLSLDLGLAAGYTTAVIRPERSLALFFEEADTHVWEIQGKIGLDYKFSEQITMGLDYRYSWHTGPDFEEANCQDIGLHFFGASVEFSF
ncbi:MAG: hypothetical protein EVB09_02590 [Verrucomicrobiaceae bacterium]|nr:MAG: hypothetical protein EVB09_02590 [Verrucomicrobiaceae bacterium]